MPSVTHSTRAIALISLLALAGCAAGPTYNPTVFAWDINEELLAEKPIKTVVIADVNIGLPSRAYLDKVAPRIDAHVGSYLKANGFKVLPQRNFSQLWNSGVRAYGNPVDPTTGKANMRTFAQIMQSVRDAMQENTNVDAFVFTNLVELEVAFSGGLKHLARWDGVTRKPALQGPGDGVSTDFDWNSPAAVASLEVYIYDTTLQRVFYSRGGLDATDAIDTRSSGGRYVRRRNLLENQRFIDEGIALAFHPFIEMEDWPGNP